MSELSQPNPMFHQHGFQEVDANSALLLHDDENAELQALATRWRVSAPQQQPVSFTPMQRFAFERSKNNKPFSQAPIIYETSTTTTTALPPTHRQALWRDTSSNNTPFQVIQKAPLSSAAKDVMLRQKSTKRLRQSKSRRLRKSKRHDRSLHSELSAYFSSHMSATSALDQAPDGSSTTSMPWAIDNTIFDTNDHLPDLPPAKNDLDGPTMWWAKPYIAQLESTPTSGWGQFVDIEINGLI